MTTSNVNVSEPVGSKRGGLRRNLTMWGAVGVALGLMAPSLAINLNPQAPALHVGRAVPLVFLLAVIGVMLVAYGFIRLCQSFHHAGSVYAFVGVTVGPRAGFVAGWTLFGTYLAYTATSVAAFGLFIQQFCISTGIWTHASWVPFSLVAYITIWVLAANEARFSTRTLITVETITVTLILIVAITIFAKLIGGSAPGHQTFTMSVFSLPAGVGYSALFFSLTFGFLSFAGFEGASTMGEETNNPTKAIPLAIFGCVVCVGIFYVFVSMAESMGFGTDAAGVTAFTSSGNLMGDLAKTYVGSTVGDVITLGVAFSALSSCLASAIGGSRLLFAFGRDGAFHRSLGRASQRTGAPIMALLMVMIVVAIEVFGLRLVSTTSVIDIFFWTATMGTLALLVCYVISTLGAMRYLFFSRVKQVRQWEIVIPIAAVLFLGYTLYHNVYPVPAWPYNLFPYIVAAWVLAATVAVYVVPGFARAIGERLRVEDGLSFPGSEIESTDIEPLP
jgi:amino acid transporter